MIGDVAVHRTHDAHIIDALPNLRENAAHLNAALPIFPEGERRFHQSATLHDMTGRFDNFVPAWFGSAVKLLQHRLGIERIYLRRSTVEEKKDDVLCARLEMRSCRRS